MTPLNLGPRNNLKSRIVDITNHCFLKTNGKTAIGDSIGRALGTARGRGLVAALYQRMVLVATSRGVQFHEDVTVCLRMRR